jgi:hypothetical protein
VLDKSVLDSVIFISNSIPKSGSSLLFNLQRDFIMSLSGRKTCDYSVLEDVGINVKGGFLPNKDIPALIDNVQTGLSLRGPLILKTHTPMTPALRAFYEANSHVFVSLIVRDPLDTLLSAMHNFRRTGEFANFENFEDGCRTINNDFQSIYDSTLRVTSKPIPIVRYTDLLTDPAAAISASFGPDFLGGVTRADVERQLDIQTSSRKASHRLQRGDLNRGIDEVSERSQEAVLEALHNFRVKLGYITPEGAEI